MLKKPVIMMCCTSIPGLVIRSNPGLAGEAASSWEARDHFCTGWSGRSEVKVHVLDRPRALSPEDRSDETLDLDDCVHQAGTIIVESLGRGKRPSVLVNAERFSLCGDPVEIRFKGGQLAIGNMPLAEAAAANLTLSGEAAESLGRTMVKVYCHQLPLARQHFFPGP